LIDREHRISFLDEIQEDLHGRLESCDLCPRKCHVNRLQGDTGRCGAGQDLVVYTAFLHHGEEPPISGHKGSGTIFFSGCSLKCVYCQNYPFSHSISGTTITPEQLSLIMIRLQEQGAENINLVTATHFLPQVCQAVARAMRRGLSIPIVYNTSGYETEETIGILGNMVDVYLADMKYVSSSLAAKYSNAADYPLINRKGLLLMSQQKKTMWEGEKLRQGLIIRHLVLPGYAEESVRALRWISGNLPQPLVSLMFQFRPYSARGQYPEIDCTVSRKEHARLKQQLDSLALEGWIQDLSTEEELAGAHFQPSLEGLLH